MVATYEAAGFACQGWKESPIKGAAAGNTEFLSYFRRLPGGAAAAADAGDSGEAGSGASGGGTC